MSGSRRLLWLVPALLLATLFAGLGQWQLERGRLKARMLDAFERVLASPPVPFGPYLARDTLPLQAELDDAVATPVQDTGLSLPARVGGQGRFDAAKTVILDNRILDGRPGAHVLVLFRPEDAARPLLVNLGWMPLDRSRPAMPEVPTSRVRVSGLLVPPPGVGIRLGDAQWEMGATPPLVSHLDIAALREQMSEALFEGQLLLDADAPFGLDRRWQALPNTLPPERHRGYAVQWFGLALAVLGVYVVMSRQRPRRGGEHR